MVNARELTTRTSDSPRAPNRTSDERHANTRDTPAPPTAIVSRYERLTTPSAGPSCCHTSSEAIAAATPVAASAALPGSRLPAP